MNPTLDQIQDLLDEDQQRFHEYTQRSLRRQWAEAENRTEREQDKTKKIKGDPNERKSKSS